MARENNEMAYIATVTYIKPIEGADAIEAAVINHGWCVVVKKGEFQVGDSVVYFEIDSWCPNSLVPHLSKGKEPREYNGVKGERLKSIRLRGQKSQGLVLPMSVLPEGDYFVGQKVGDILGIQKWEAPQTFNAGMAKGNFYPGWRKSDEERIENLVRDVFHDPKIMETQFEVTVKLDGSSMSVGLMTDDNGDDFVICSRNIWLKNDDDTSHFIKTAKNVFGENGEKLVGHKNLQFLGELIAPNIQKNFEKVDAPQYRVFNIFDVDKGVFLGYADRQKICNDLGIEHVPVLTVDTLNNLGLTDMEKMKEFSEGPSINSDKREGVVFKSIDGRFTFKCVTDSYAFSKNQ